MLRSQLLLLTACSLGIVGAASFIGCGDSDATGGNGGSSSAGGIRPPSPPDGGTPGDKSAPKIFGVTKLYLGTTTRAGVPSATAWEEFGYDLDNQVTQNTTDFAKHCKPQGNGNPSDIFKDGKDGRDNVFGKKLLGLIKVAAMGSDLEVEANDALKSGSFTLILDMADLGAGKNYNPLDVRLVAGKNGTPEGAPTSWELVPELLSGAKAGTADSTVKFPSSYLNDNVWVSGTPGEVKLSLGFGDIGINLVIKAAVLTMKLDEAHNTVTEGTVAGVLETEALISQIETLGKSLAPDIFCDSSGSIDSVLDQLRGFSDIMADGTQNPNLPCNGLSIGLGFDAAPITIARVGDPAMQMPEACPMTTTSSSSSSGSSSSSSTSATSSSASTGSGL